MYESVFIRIDINLITKNCPLSILGEIGIKRYLHILLLTDNRKGYTISGHQSFVKHTRYFTPQAFKDAERMMSELGFIEQRQLAQKLTATTPLNVPFTNNGEEYYRFGRVRICNRDLAQSRIDYILVPQSAALQALRMPINKLLVYLKLYRYNSHEVFGGIDINAVYMKNSKLIINRRIMYDLCMSKKTVEDCIKQLMQDELINYKEAKMKTSKLGIYKRLRIIPLEEKGTKIRQLVPYYQFGHGN